ncbi:MAG: hypothetical protein UC708_08375 [Anaerovoracaceae bacterium]|nr:hypothetical protein [Bacillota bacterium]MEE0517875.1 hypothetical protein [Anaerovoracaceae bacterium]
MSIGATGAFLLFLVIVFIFGDLWFHLIEGILQKIKRIFTHHKESAAWHPFPSDKDE